ncbi:MAG TPA: DNA-binding protein [Flavobacteriaceae bacterium]|nr:DNA-binding protein [Flavobacteriaceae bacterium]HIN98065.1 DNA-binding protein [Flavobacteriaceae bacterium]
MSVIQMIQMTPEDLQEQISTTIKGSIDTLVKTLSKKPCEEYLTRKEVAQLFKVDLSTVHNWTKSGKIQSYGLGGRLYYKRSEIDNSLVKLK